MLGWVRTLLQCDGEALVHVNFTAEPRNTIRCAMLAADEHGVVLAKQGYPTDWTAYPWTAIAAIGPQGAE